MKKLIVNCETGEQEYVDLTPEEIAQVEADAIQAQLQVAEQEALEAEKSAAKQSANEKLAALGLSAEEIAAITGA